MCSLLTFLGMPSNVTIGPATQPPTAKYPFTLTDNGQTWCCGMPNCSKRIEVTKKSLIVYHRNTHCPKYECEHCGELFPQKSRMETHVRTIHTGEKPYGCQQCERAFPQLSNLQDHVRKAHPSHADAEVHETNNIGSLATSPAAQAAKRYAAFREKESVTIKSEFPEWSYPQITSEVARRWREAVSRVI